MPGTPETGQEGRRIVHIDFWRERLHTASGISTSTEQEAKKKAFGRDITELRNGGWIETRNDFWWPARDTGQGRDIAGTCPGTK